MLFKLYFAHLSQLNLEEFQGYITPEELASYHTLKLPAVRQARILGQGFKRKILADFLNQSPQSLKFNISDYGKPLLADQSLFFNLSHAGDFLVLALSEQRELGVDIECYKKIDYWPIAKRFFHELEQDQIQNSVNPEHTFFQLWTYKEAFVKAIGLGLSYGLDRFAVDEKTGRFLSIEPQYQHCQLSSISQENLKPGYWGAVCVLGN